MDSLPVEIILKILQKAELSTNLKLKYFNQRISAIMKKYMKIIEVNEIRVQESVQGSLKKYTIKIFIYNGSECRFYSSRYLFDNKVHELLGVSPKIVIAEYLYVPSKMLHNRQDPVFEQLKNLKNVKHLHVNGCRAGRNLIKFLKKYNIETLNITGNMRGAVTIVNWNELLEQDISLKHISIVSDQGRICLNQGFLDYVRTKTVKSLELSGLFLPSDFAMFFHAIQEAIDRKTSINWVIQAPNIDFTRMKKFLEDNRGTIHNLSEAVIVDLKKLAICLPNGQVTFISRYSYFDWEQKHVETL